MTKKFGDHKYDQCIILNQGQAGYTGTEKYVVFEKYYRNVYGFNSVKEAREYIDVNPMTSFLTEKDVNKPRTQAKPATKVYVPKKTVPALSRDWPFPLKTPTPKLESIIIGNVTVEYDANEIAIDYYSKRNIRLIKKS